MTDTPHKDKNGFMCQYPDCGYCKPKLLSGDVDEALERLKTEAERWIPWIAENYDDALGNAGRGLRDVVQRAYDLGHAQSSNEHIESTLFRVSKEAIDEAHEELKRKFGDYPGSDWGYQRDLARMIAAVRLAVTERCVPSSKERICPYCTSDNPAIQDTYYDQTCEGCVKRMGRP